MKTAKQLVYDAIQHLRQKYEGVELSPITDEDHLRNDFGFTDKEDHKLMEMINIDGDLEFGCMVYHNATTVGQLVKEIEKGLTLPTPAELLGVRDLIHKSKIANVTAEISIPLGFITAFKDKLGVEQEEIDNLYKAFRNFIMEYYNTLNKLDFLDVDRIQMKDIKGIQEKVTKASKEYCKVLIDIRDGRK